MRWISLLVMLVMLAPAGQALDAEAGYPEEPLVVGEAWSGELTVRASCEEVLASGDRMLSWEAASEPPGIQVDGESARLLDPTACTTEREVVETIPFQLTAAREAPGEVPIRLTFNVTLGDAVTEAIAEVEVAWLGEFTAEVAGNGTNMKQGAPQTQIVYLIEIENLGNARAVFRFHLVTTDPVGNPVLPGEIILESPMQGGPLTKDVVEFVYSTPFENGQNDFEEDLSLRVTAHSTQEADVQADQEETLHFTAKTRGYYVPGPASWLVIGVLALAAARLRRS